MLPLIIMVIIGLANESNLWLYLALGVSIFYGFVKLTRTMAGFSTSATSAQLEAAINAVRAKNN